MNQFIFEIDFCGEGWIRTSKSRQCCRETAKGMCLSPLPQDARQPNLSIG